MRRLSLAASAALAIVLWGSHVDSAMLGPNGPLVADTDGQPGVTAGDLRFAPRYGSEDDDGSDNGPVVVLQNPWDCNPLDEDNMFSLLNFDADGRPLSAERTTDHGTVQRLTYTDFVGDHPIAAELAKNGTVRGHGALLDDRHEDGVFDTIELTLEDFKVMVDLLVQKNDDGVPEYVTLDWGLSSFFGVDHDDTCGPKDPSHPDADAQVFVPLHEIQSGPHPLYSVVADIDGDDEPDNLFAGPALAAAPNQPPDCAGVTPSRDHLWPPNHRFVPVHLGGASDPEGDPVEIQITGVTQDEADGSCPDAKIVDPDTVELRAERLGKGDGRVYHVDFTATDDGGEACSGQVNVCVPHNQGHGAACVDQGPKQNSITCGP